jgi:hypothetical protein
VAFFSFDPITRAEFRLLRSVRVIMGAKRRSIRCAAGKVWIASQCSK